MVDRILPHEQTDPARNETIIAEGISFEDFLKSFGDQHAEWLMGKVISVSTNDARHNTIQVLVAAFLYPFLRDHPLGQLLSAVPMYITDKQPARAPDILVVLNKNSSWVKSGYMDGPADLVVEVISSESTIRDRGDKFSEYEVAGVSEYWLLDPNRKDARVYVLGEDGVYHLHSLDSQGRLNSVILPEFNISPDVLWQEEPPLVTEQTDLILPDGRTLSFPFTKLK